MKNKSIVFYFVLAIPVINTIAANTANYSPSPIYNTGTLRALLLILFLLYFLFVEFPKNKSSRIILFSVIYLLLLVPFASDLFFSLNGIIKYSLGVLMFPVGYYYFNTYEKYTHLIKILIIILVLYLISIVISNIFNLGTSDYASDTFYFGSGSVNITKDILILVLIAPISFFLFPKYKKILSILYLIGFVVALIGIKRSVLISAILGVLTYGYKTGFNTRYVKLILVGGFLLLSLVFLFPSVYNTFLIRLTAREEQLTLEEEKIEKEARYNETFLVLETWQNGSIGFKLFGNEPFNDRYYYKTDRMLHTDYMIMLNGTGIIGIFFWFYIYYSIFMEKNKYRNFIRSNKILVEINAIFTAFLFAQLFMSISSTVYAISLRAIIFLFWGASLSLIKSMYLEHQKRIEFPNKKLSG